MSPYGDTIDFRGRNPNFSNIPLIKIDPRTGRAYIAFYALCGLVFLSVLFTVPFRALTQLTRTDVELERFETQDRGFHDPEIIAENSTLRVRLTSSPREIPQHFVSSRPTRN